MDAPAPEIAIVPVDGRDAVVADVYARPGDGARAVVLCHGFKGYRRWGFIPHLARRLAGAGIAAVAFDFSHNGRVPADAGQDGWTDGGAAGVFTAPERFRRNTLERQTRDLAAVIAWIRAGGVAAVASDTAVGLWGHSLGGVTALLAALDDPAIAAVATWSTPAHPDHYTARQKRVWREEGALAFADHETGTALALGIEFLDDLERHHDHYAVAERAGALGAPHLIIHGEHDLAVPVGDAARFTEVPAAVADKKCLRLLTGHTFGWDAATEPGQALRRAADATVQWFDTYLGGKRTS
jgi:dienelactone hydrolase